MGDVRPNQDIIHHTSYIQLHAVTVSSAIDELESRFPAIRGRLRDESGAMRRFVNLYVNGEDVRFQHGLETALKAGDELSIVPAVAGGDA